MGHPTISLAHTKHFKSNFVPMDCILVPLFYSLKIYKASLGKLSSGIFEITNVRLLSEISSSFHPICLVLWFIFVSTEIINNIA